ncbi:helix-turn-helix domain-containing protein [Faecalicoccus pleomorphus]|uniref:helix-turn-helix domain-containing protein n=1 Tax=Faecalicoccus pleomorphus TaxID=1323 RepID=UPI0022E3A5D4|nr:helix-turn-helix domain-containing protein [Faecalicoccus pleomorphus]
MKIEDKIRQARLRKGITQNQIAEKIGISQPTYAQWENGKRKPKLETLKKIADALEVPVSILYDDYEFVDPGEGLTEDQKAKQKAHDQEQLEVIKKFYSRDKLLHNFNAVNEEGQQKIVEYSNDIAENPKYKKGDD